MPEKISADEALRRGYEWIQCGYNHALNKPIIGSIRQLKPFLVNRISVSALNRIRDCEDRGEREASHDEKDCLTTDGELA